MDHIFHRVPDLVTALVDVQAQDIENGATPAQAMLNVLDKAFGIYRHEVADEVREMTDVPGAAEIAERLAPDVRRRIAEAKKSTPS